MVCPLQTLKPFAKFIYFVGYRRKSFGERIVDLLGISDYDALPFPEDDMPRDTDNRGVVGNVAQHNRAGADSAVLAYHNVAENLGAAADHDAIFESRVSLAVFLARAAERDSLIEGYVIADHRGFANHDSHAVVDK